MDKLTRRGFLEQTSVSVATLGVLTAAAILEVAHEVPGLSTGLATTNMSSTSYPQDLVAHVRNFATGEISLMLGTQEVVLRDYALTQRLLKATH